jgi:phosphate starvation-inducible protein PhoH
MYITHHSLLDIQPIGDVQKNVFEAYGENKNIFSHGVAGSGKTFILLYLALKEVLDKRTPYERVVIIRSLLPSRDVGFLPGTLEEKSDLYQDPYRILVRTMFEMPSDADFLQLYDKLVAQGSLEFITTSFLRGQTFDRTIVVVDEFQNMIFSELDTLITRVGQESKVMFAGDTAQTDLKNGNVSGHQRFTTILESMKEFYIAEFGFGDIVRSGLVRSYLIAKHNLGMKDSS